jgi:hypothetical protein
LRGKVVKNVQIRQLLVVLRQPNQSIDGNSSIASQDAAHLERNLQSK